MLGSHPSLTRSRQIYHLNLEGGNCELAFPDPGLSKYIDYYWLLSIEQPTLSLEVIPDTAVDLVISPDISDFAALYLPSPSRFTIDLQGPVHYAGTCFRLERSAALLKEDLKTLSQLRIGAELVEHLQLAPLLTAIHDDVSIDSLTQRLNGFWLSRLDASPETTDPSHGFDHSQLISALEHSLDSKSISRLCDTLGISDRQFRRLSNELLGISPKKLQNILRLQRALGELFQCEPQQLQDWYYDDSHRIRELKRLTGFTPGQIRTMAEKYNQG